MNKHICIIIIVLSIAGITVCKAQSEPLATALFTYDATGNRIQRYIDNPTWLIIKNDSIKTRYGNLINDSLLIVSLDSLEQSKTNQSIKREAIQVASEYGISVYPNPTPDMVTVYSSKSTEEEKPLLLSVYDNNGKLINSYRHYTTTSVNLSNFADGTYHLIVSLPDQKKLHYKVLKIR